MPVVDHITSNQAAGPIIAREVLATAASLLLYPFGLIKSQRRTARRAAQRTVVIVHGYLANPSGFLPLVAYLKALGFPTPLAYRYPPSWGVEQAAIGLKEFLRQRVRGGRIDLVCHSLGGVVARTYLQQLGGARRVDNCITLGTPHRGTYGAYWLWSQLGRDLRPDSPFMERLARSHDQAAAVRFLSIVGSSDNIVVPRVFGAIADDLHYIPNVGHLGLLYSLTVFRLVAGRLAN